MKIAYLVAGAGRMHCGACSHDYLYITYLRHLGHDVTVLPLYTPFWTDLGQILNPGRIFMGGISMYLRVEAPTLAPLVAPFRPLLDSRPLLTQATRHAIQTDPGQLGPMTLSMLQGLAGPHAPEVERLLQHIQAQVKPQVVILTNTMLAAFAPPLRERLNIPVLAHFQGEDGFLMDLPEAQRDQAIALLREASRSLSAVVCPSEAGAQQAGILLQMNPDRLPVIAAPIEPAAYGRRPALPHEPFTIGYLSVIRPAKGLDILLRAMQVLADQTPMPLRLLIAGQILNSRYAKEMRKLASALPPRVEVEFGGEVTFEQKVGLLRRCHLFCLPSRIQEARAMAAMEAMACGVPVVAPRLGVFPELLSAGGGFLYDPEDVSSLAQILRRVAEDRRLLDTAATHALTTLQQKHLPAEIIAQFDDLLVTLGHCNLASRPPSPETYFPTSS